MRAPKVMRGIVVATIVLFAGCGSPAGGDADRDLLMRVDADWSNAWTDRDKFLSYYAPDASLYPEHMAPVTGAGPIRDAIMRMGAVSDVSLTWSVLKASVSASGDLGYTAGTYLATGITSPGQPTPERGMYLAVWRKDSGQWKVIEHIFNLYAPPAAASRGTWMTHSPHAAGPHQRATPPNIRLPHAVLRAVAFHERQPLQIATGCAATNWILICVT
jgi:ketosteroid isomerase-like protein